MTPDRLYCQSRRGRSCREWGSRAARLAGRIGRNHPLRTGSGDRISEDCSLKGFCRDLLVFRDQDLCDTREPRAQCRHLGRSGAFDAISSMAGDFICVIPRAAMHILNDLFDIVAMSLRIAAIHVNSLHSVPTSNISASIYRTVGRIEHIPKSEDGTSVGGRGGSEPKVLR